MSVLTLDQRFTLSMPEGTISDTGQELISALIASQKIREDAWKALNPDIDFHYLQPLPNDWNWVWVVTRKADFVGTFAKRVSKYYHVAQGLKCPAEFIQEIGNIARSHSSDAMSYDFEFVARIDWEAGAFGDDGSCWWGEYEEARSLLIDNGGRAVRFYRDGAGIGRAWMAPYNETLYILFNGYGFVGDSTLVIARIVAEFLGLSYKRIELENHNGLMFINNDTGYLIGPHDMIAPVDTHLLRFGRTPESVSTQTPPKDAAGEG